jgi:large-conductance mechanosensitive channel
MTDIYSILSNFSILDVAVATTIGLSTKDFVYKFVDGLIIPLIMIILGNNKNLLFDYNLKIRGVNIPLGETLKHFIKFIVLITIVLVFITYFIRPLSEEIINRKNELQYKGLDKIDKCIHKLYDIDNDMKTLHNKINNDNNYQNLINKQNYT